MARHAVPRQGADDAGVEVREVVGGFGHGRVVEVLLQRLHVAGGGVLPNLIGAGHEDVRLAALGGKRDVQLVKVVLLGGHGEFNVDARQLFELFQLAVIGDGLLVVVLVEHHLNLGTRESLPVDRGALGRRDGHEHRGHQGQRQNQREILLHGKISSSSICLRGAIMGAGACRMDAIPPLFPAWIGRLPYCASQHNILQFRNIPYRYSYTDLKCRRIDHVLESTFSLSCQ